MNTEKKSIQSGLPILSALESAHGKKIAPLFERYRREKVLHPTLLFTGMEGIGKKSLVRYFVQTLFCDQGDFSQSSSGPFSGPCNECKSCKRALQNQWIDLHWLDPESSDSEKRLGTHKIDAFREIKTKLGFAPSQEPFQVMVIADADRMTPQAANSILKMLEEPPPHWIFILTSSDSSRLLPTILSRCMEIKLSPLDADQVYAALKEIHANDYQSDKLKFASRAAQGSLTRAHFFLGTEAWEIRNLILGCLTHPARDWLALVERISLSPIQLNLGMDLIESLLMDLVQFKIKGDAHIWIHEDQKDFLVQWMEHKKKSHEQILYLLSEISEKRKFVPLTLNAKLLAQNVLKPLLEVIQ